MNGPLWKALGRLPGNEASQIVVDHKQLAIQGLPAGLAGLRLIHLSDLHMTGRMSRAFYEELTDKVCQQEADVIALTGDIVENVDCWAWFDGTLGRMKARYGSYFILGNHDLLVDSNETIRRLCELGWEYAGGQALPRKFRDVDVTISGNEMPWRPAPTITPRVAPNPSQKQPSTMASPGLHLGLLHTPDQWRWSVDHDVHLALAGHTHGGQICFPGLGPVASPSLYGTRYACGVFRRGKMAMHVSRGLAGMTPVRWNCPPELAVLELVPA